MFRAFLLPPFLLLLFERHQIIITTIYVRSTQCLDSFARANSSQQFHWRLSANAKNIDSAVRYAIWNTPLAFCFITSLIHLVRAYYKHLHPNHQRQRIRSCFFSIHVCRPIGPLLQGHGVLRGNEGGKASRERCCCSRRNSWASPLHALQFFSPPTGTSKQDLSGMKIRVAQKCTGLVMPKYASAESQIIPLLFNISPAVPREKNPKEWSPTILWNWFGCCMLLKCSLQNLTDLVRPPYLTRPD